jgi:serine phosphatase RsbU (regulator of sigma subunit)
MAIRISIAWRIIFGTIFTIILLLGGFGYLSSQRLEVIFQQTGAEQRESYIRNIQRAGKAQLFSLQRLSAVFLKAAQMQELMDAIPPIGREDAQLDVVTVFNAEGYLASYYDNRYPTAKILREDKVFLVGDPSFTGKLEVVFTEYPFTDVLTKADSDDAKPPAGTKNAPQGLPEGLDVRARSVDGVRVVAKNGEERMLFVGAIVDEGVYLGTVAMMYNLRSLQDYEKTLAAALKKNKEETFRNLVKLGGILLLLGVLFSVFQGLRITRPIKSLVRSVATFAHGDLAHRVRIKTHDEIEVLGDGFNFMAENLVILLSESEKKAVMAKELEVAKTIQDSLVPASGLHEFPTITLAGHFLSASETGGDWWSYYKISGDRLMVVIGDVTGHGVPAAMITAAAKSACDTILAIENLIPDLDQFANILNNSIAASGKGQFFMTCFVSIIDPAKKNMKFVNAGHNFPYLYRPAEDKFIQLMARGPRLGEPGSTKYEIKDIDLQPNDLIVWYTDGIIEDQNQEGAEYGDKRFRKSIKEANALSLEAALKKIVEDADAFYTGVPHQDDHTLILGRITQ